MKILKKNIFILLLSLLSISISAQQFSVSGKLTDSDGNALIGVNVVIKGTTQGTITDNQGTYVIDKLQKDQMLIFSYIGFLDEEVQVGTQTTIDVSLMEDLVGLNEVVVLGYGTQYKKDVTGSVSSIDEEDLISRSNNQFGSLIQGKAAGVKVSSSSGKPSEGFSIRIRGTNSINASSEPLYVVDGVPTTDTRSINPSDIETISILKDASSAAIYGAQGANGVVLISTKRGTTKKPQVNFNMYLGTSQVWKTIDVLDGQQYQDLMTEMRQNTDWDLYNKNTDWQDEIFQNGSSQNYQLSIAGTNDNTNYYLSGGYVEQNGAVRSARMDRYNFKINIDQTINDHLKIGSRIAYNKYSDVDVKDNTDVNKGGVLLGSLSTPSVIGIYNEDGTFTSNPFQNWENPIAHTDGSDREYNSQRFLGNLYLELEVLKGLKFKSNLGIDNGNGIYNYFLDPYRTSYGRALVGQGQHNEDQSSYHILENTLRYNAEIENHKFEVLAGSVVQKFFWENSSIERQNFASDGIKTVNGGSVVINATADQSEKANASYIGRFNYAYADKYLLTGNFRADGSSVFGPENRWGYFPSFSLGWRVSKENFLQNVSLINDLKLRAGWGLVGNDQIGNYAYLGRVGVGANYPIGGVVMPGTYPASIENSKLKWEESEQINLGIDLVLLNSRISFTADAYVKNTRDLLLNAPLPHSTGFDNAIQNIGELQNKGIEFAIRTRNFEGDFSWTSDFVISFNKNEVKSLVGQEMVAGNIAGRGDAILISEGNSLGTFYGYVFAGVDPETGDAYYLNQEGESTFDPIPEDRQVIGNANPDFIYGFTNVFAYKSISLLLFIEGSQGNDMLNATRFDTEGMTDPKNQSAVVLQRWKEVGDVTDVPRASWGNTNNSRISTRFIEDASYLRVKTLTLTYTVPKKVVEKMKASNLRIYATGENLLTFTDYSGFDPEVNAFGDSNTALGIDYGTYPQTRNLILGISLSF